MFCYSLYYYAMLSYHKLSCLAQLHHSFTLLLVIRQLQHLLLFSQHASCHVTMPTSQDAFVWVLTSAARWVRLFKLIRLISYLAPGYKIPPRMYFSRTEIPKLYNDVKSKITPHNWHLVVNCQRCTYFCHCSICHLWLWTEKLHSGHTKHARKAYRSTHWGTFIITKAFFSRLPKLLREHSLQLLSEWGLEKASGTSTAATTDNASNKHGSCFWGLQMETHPLCGTHA